MVERVDQNGSNLFPSAHASGVFSAQILPERFFPRGRFATLRA